MVVAKKASESVTEVAMYIVVYALVDPNCSVQAALVAALPQVDAYALKQTKILNLMKVSEAAAEEAGASQQEEAGKFESGMRGVFGFRPVLREIRAL